MEEYFLDFAETFTYSTYGECTYDITFEVVLNKDTDEGVSNGNTDRGSSSGGLVDVGGSGGAPISTTFSGFSHNVKCHKKAVLKFLSFVVRINSSRIQGDGYILKSTKPPINY